MGQIVDRAALADDRLARSFADDMAKLREALGAADLGMPDAGLAANESAP
jgi:hypothetical protein